MTRADVPDLIRLAEKLSQEAGELANETASARKLWNVLGKLKKKRGKQ